MSTEQETNKEIQRLLRLLKSTEKLAKDASLTGALEGGEKRCIKQFNNALQRLVEMGLVSEALFDPLEEGASFGEVSVACAQLTAYLEDEASEETKKQQAGVKAFGDVVIANIGGELKDLGELVREAIPDFLKKEWKAKKTEGSEKQSDQVSKKEGETQDPTLNSVESQIAELGGQMQVLAERLRRNVLPPEEIQRLAEEMRQLGEKQAQLARQHATLRNKD